MSAAREQHMDTIRKAAFPTPSPFGVEWEKQRATEAHTLIHRWAQGRTENGADLGTGNRDGDWKQGRRDWKQGRSKLLILAACLFLPLTASPFLPE